MKKSLLILVLLMQSNCYGSQMNNNHKELQDKEIEEIEERKKYNFGQHLTANFPEDKIIEFLLAASYLTEHQERHAEKSFTLACNNYYKQKDAPLVDPATCANVGEYLEKLKSSK